MEIIDNLSHTTCRDENLSNFCTVSDISASKSNITPRITPDFSQGIISPHTLQNKKEEELDNPFTLSVTPVECSLTEQRCVNMHRLLHTDTTEEKDEKKCTTHRLSIHRLTADISPSPSPLPEPMFEPYVICTKTRSETSSSGESQCSTSSTNSSNNDRDYMSSGSVYGTPRSAPISASPRSNAHNVPTRRDFTFCDSSANQRHAHLSSTLHECIDERYDDGGGGVILISPDQDFPLMMGKTKPIRLPQKCHDNGDDSSSPPNSPLYFPSLHPTTPPTPPLKDASQRKHPLSGNMDSEFQRSLNFQKSRAITFLQCKAGEESGKFIVDYLGMKEVDLYIKSINSVAKDLAAERPKEIQVYVTSEKIRLAPPNSPTLYQSFAIKDVLLVRKCSKNTRIIGIMVWKPSSGKLPMCHILRCQDNLVAGSLFDALWQQTQKVDDVSLNMSHHSNHSSYPLSDQPGTLSSKNDANNLSTATDFLHRFPALYIGSSPATGKLRAINLAIEKVLTETKPSQAKQGVVSLSLLEVQLDLNSLENTGRKSKSKNIMSHETSRIRRMGVYSGDKRFSGYIIKEEDKPLTVHVIMCNSAALMVSFTSFLRQSCQLTSHQRGGSFYEELSTDESGDWEGYSNSENSTNESPGSLKRRFKSLTTSLSHRNSNSISTSSPPKSMPHPSFQSHVRPSSFSHSHSPPSSSSSSPSSSSANNDVTTTTTTTKKTPTSPLEFNEEEYAKFSVTYVGSAMQESSHLTLDSIDDALRLFESDGIAGGRAAIIKNSIDLQISSLGINLTDSKQKLFIHRNYPLRTISGYCRHSTDSMLFAFASYRPGFSKVQKVHVFRRCGAELVEQILAAMKYWLEMDPAIIASQ